MVNPLLSFQVYSGMFEVVGQLPVRTAIEHGYVPQPARTGDVLVDKSPGVCEDLVVTLSEDGVVSTVLLVCIQGQHLFCKYTKKMPKKKT